MTKQYCNTHINKDDIKFSLVKNILHIFYIEINILAIKPKFVSWYSNLILICGSWRLSMVFKSDISSRSPVLPPSHSIFLSLLFATLLPPALLHCSYCELWWIHVPAHVLFRIVKSIYILIILERKRSFALRLRRIRISWFSLSYMFP